MSDLDSVLRHLRPLITLNTTSDRSNRELIDLIADWMAAVGVRAHILPTEDGGKAGLLASIGPMRAGGVVLSGHTDTVPVEGQLWRSNPFTLVERGGRLIGRGAADMKGFIAVVLAMLPVFVKARLQVPIHVLFSYDEEIGCLAAPDLVAAVRDRLPLPALAIVGEPSEMRIATSHRGIATYTTTVKGRAGHSGLPQSGASAIVAAARCVLWLEELVAREARCEARSPDESREGGDPLTTTLNIGTIEGGAAINIIAPDCQFEWECRPAPGFTVASVETDFERFIASEVLPGLRRRAPEARIETVRRVLVPPLLPAATSESAWIEATALAWAGAGSAPTTVPFASEAGFLQASGIPTVICGPGSPRQAHQADEFVSADQLRACVTFMQRMIEWAQRPDSERRPPLAPGLRVS